MLFVAEAEVAVLWWFCQDVSPLAKPPEHHGVLGQNQLDLAKSPEHHDILGHDQLDLAKLPEHHDLLGNGDLDLAKPPQHRGLSLGHEEHQEQDYLCPHHTKS
ncbi:hypothetical protein Tco_1049814 [Tanacetum coccineum]